MSEEAAITKWSIPFGVGYEKLVKIIRYIYQKKGDQNFVPLDSILSLTSINPQSIKNNLSFFKIIKILEGDNSKGYKLTQAGTKYVKALTMNDNQEIKNMSLEIIRNSHLKDLKHFVETEGNSLTKEGLYKFVKSNARISDGDRFGNMPAVYSSGTGALLEIFSLAGLINEEVIKQSTTRSTSKTSTQKIKKGSKMQSQKRRDEAHQEEKGDNFNSSTNSFSITINKKIDKDEFDLVKSQITSFLQFVEKKISSSS